MLIVAEFCMAKYAVAAIYQNFNANCFALFPNFFWSSRSCLNIFSLHEKAPSLFVHIQQLFLLMNLHPLKKAVSNFIFARGLFLQHLQLTVSNEIL